MPRVRGSLNKRSASVPSEARGTSWLFQSARAADEAVVPAPAERTRMHEAREEQVGADGGRDDDEPEEQAAPAAANAGFA